MLSEEYAQTHRGSRHLEYSGKSCIEKAMPMLCIRDHHREKVFLVAGSSVFKVILLCKFMLYLRNCK